jgi:hypothetical protein
MYAGQTDDFRVRERSRQDYVTAMGVPAFNICFKHSLDNEYHRDALEVALMAYNFLIFGLSQINRSPYGNNWYTNVQLDIEVDDINASHYSRRLGWTAWRYALLVGTAPPQRIALDPTYHDFLNGSRSLNPLMDFARFPARQGGGLDMFLRLLGMDDQPGFINHYPHNICDRMNDWSPNLSNQQIETADHQFRSSLQAYGTHLAVMLGHRPTRLAAQGGPQNYFARLCGRLTATNLENGNVVLLLWTPHPSIANRVTWNTRTIDRILSLVPIIVSVSVIGKHLNSMEIEHQSSSATGLTAPHAQAIIAWYKQSPIGKKMLFFTEVFRQEWINHRNNHEQVQPNDIECLFGKFFENVWMCKPLFTKFTYFI